MNRETDVAHEAAEACQEPLLQGKGASASFPWPDEELARTLFASDPFYGEIPLPEREQIFSDVWRRGREQAAVAWEETGRSGEIERLYRANALTIVEKAEDCQIAGQRYFSEYSSGRRQVTLYQGSIALWARHHAVEPLFAEQVFLAHEYFHFLECVKIGLSSRLCRLPLLRIGRFYFGTKGIRMLCEVGATAFSQCWAEDLRELNGDSTSGKA